MWIKWDGQDLFPKNLPRHKIVLCKYEDGSIIKNVAGAFLWKHHPIWHTLIVEYQEI